MSANPWVGCGPEGVLHYCSYCNHDVDDRTPAQDLAAAQKRIEELEGELETARYREANLRSQWPQILKDGQRYITEANEEFAKRKTAEGRIAELEAQVAQHPEQLRRVAEAVVWEMIRASAAYGATEGMADYAADVAQHAARRLGMAVGTTRLPALAHLPSLDAIIKLATKP